MHFFLFYLHKLYLLKKGKALLKNCLGLASTAHLSILVKTIQPLPVVKNKVKHFKQF